MCGDSLFFVPFLTLFHAVVRKTSMVAGEDSPARVTPGTRTDGTVPRFQIPLRGEGRTEGTKSPSVLLTSSRQVL